MQINKNVSSDRKLHGIPTITPYSIPRIENLTPNRVAWKLNVNRAVLLIHDLQEYFVDAFDRSQEPYVSMMRHVSQLRELAQSRGIPVVQTRQPATQSLVDRGLLQDMWGPGIVGKHEGVPFASEMPKNMPYICLEKTRYSAFVGTDLHERMIAWNRDQLIVSGIYAHIGCQATALDAFMKDIQPFFVADAVADFSQDHHQSALEFISTRCGVVISAEQVLKEFEPENNEDLSDGERDRILFIKSFSKRCGIPVEKLGAEQRITDLGVDSLRWVAMLETWCEEANAPDFLSLIQCETVGELELLCSSRYAAGTGISDEAVS